MQQWGPGITRADLGCIRTLGIKNASAAKDVLG